MPVIRLPQAYTNTYAAQNVRDALMSIGEEVIVLSAYHLYADLGTQPRCRNFDNVYEQEDHWNCSRCYGTTFEGGIKVVSRAWSIFTDHPLSEVFDKFGEWTSDNRAMQIEGEPSLLQHDFVVRVKQWSNTHTPISFGDRYIVDEVIELTLRTGNNYGQQHGVDTYGQYAKVHRLPSNHPIFGFNISTSSPIARIDGLPR